MYILPGGRDETVFSPFLVVGSHGFADAVGEGDESVVGIQLHTPLVIVNVGQDADYRAADFQALQFRVADIATSLETARSMLWRAASALDEKSPEATRLCAMAKQIATDTGFNAANDALQLFGGYGYLADYGVEKIVRDLRVHQILEGTNEIMRVIVARGLIEN